MRRAARSTLATAALLVVAACAPMSTPPPAPEAPAAAPPVADVPAPAPSASAETTEAPARTLRGKVSTYGSAFAGRKTASGEIFDPEGLTMAHRTLPFGTRVRVTNLENQRSVEVLVNDRGPAVPGRIADLSTAAARQLGMMTSGVVNALLEIVSPASGR